MADVSKALARVAAAPWRMALVVLGVSFLGATLASTMIAHLFLPKEGRPPAAKAATAAGAFTVPNPTASLNQASIDLILKRNIFNSEGAADEATEKKAASGEQKVTEIGKSDLPVKLLGTIYGGDPFSGIALVENSTKRSVNSFMVGDSLTKEATVKEVHKEKIIIDRSGRLEYIAVVKEPLVRNKRKKKTASPDNQMVAPLATEKPPSTFHEEGFERKERDMTMTDAYRKKLLTTDFPKVLQDAKATPNMVEGELRGFCLSRIRKDSIYEKAGFENEDCVTEINGVPLTDTAQAIKLLNSLRNESDIEVRVNRGGAPLKLNLSVH